VSPDAALDQSLTTDELTRRSARPADPIAEGRALAELAHGLASAPDWLPQRLADVALALCRAGSAGLSRLEEGPDGGLVRWLAAAGRYRPAAGLTFPGPGSPCAAALERGAPQLFLQPARQFPAAGRWEPPALELLVVPVRSLGRPLGTLWVAAHDDRHRFDPEDARLLGDLAGFAVTALRPAPAAGGEGGFRALVELSDDAIIILGRDATVRYASPGAQRMGGHPPEAVLGRSGFDFVDPQDRPALEAAFAECLARPGRRVPIRARFRHADGSPRHGEGNCCNRLDDPAVGGVVVTFHDVTDRAAAEAALRRSREEARAVFELAGIGTAQLDPADGRFLRVNRKLCALTGYPEAELLGLTVARLAHPDDPDPAGLARLARGESAEHTAEARFLRKDGQAFWGQVSASLARDAAGRPGPVTLVVQDVTEQRRLGEELRQAQKMEAVGRLAGGVAHDFNNLLTIVIGNVDQVRGSLPADPAAREGLAQVEHAAQRAAELTRQLLAFGRKAPLTLQVLDFNAVVGKVAPLLRRLIGAHITLVTDLAPSLPPVKADATLLEQAILNLTANARDAMPQGGTLTLATAAVALTPAEVRRRPGLQPGPHVRLTVGDTGQGMDAETVARLFEPFFTTKEAGKGTGLGLASVYGAVRQSGGVVYADSVVGRGTTFTVLLPPTGEQLPAPAAPPARPAAAPGGATVLVAEDEDAVRSLVRQTLARLGCAVLEAADGPAALRVAAGHADRIDLLLTDVIMPGMGGPELAKQLLKERPGLKVVFMSGYAESAIVGTAALGGQGWLLSKPFSVGELSETVREALQS
jgi:PAS domain S-box-containing protein